MVKEFDIIAGQSFSLCEFDICLRQETLVSEFDICVRAMKTECDLVADSIPYFESGSRIVIGGYALGTSARKKLKVNSDAIVDIDIAERVGTRLTDRVSAEASISASVELVLGRYRLLPEMDENNLSVYDPDQLGDVDFYSIE